MTSKDDEVALLGGAGAAMKDDPAASKLLLGIDVICKEGFLTLIKVVLLPHQPQDEEEAGDHHRHDDPIILLQVFLSPHQVTVQQIKSLVLETKQIPKQEQFLFLDREGENKPLYCGRIFSLSSQQQQNNDSNKVVYPTQCTLWLRRVPMDPRLEGLFGMVQLEDVEERDNIMMQLATTSRRAKHCYQGHALPQVAPSDAELMETVTASDESCISTTCARCFFQHLPESRGSHSRNGVNLKIHPCCSKKCPFSLCTHCLQNDNGRMKYENPVEGLIDLAIYIAKQRAVHASWFGSAGHWCGYPTLRWGSDDWQSEMRPHKLRPAVLLNSDGRRDQSMSRQLAFAKSGPDRQGPTATGPNTVVLHPRVHLVVRCSDHLRELLLLGGGESETTKARAELEVDTIVPDEGFACHHVMEIRSSLKKSTFWRDISRALHKQFPHYASPHAYERMKLISFGVEHLVYELDAGISDGDY